MSIRDFLIAVASTEDAHGAVSASGVAAGMGTSLLLMVADLPRTKSDSINDRTVLTRATLALSDVHQQLLETIETETAVKIFAAHKMRRDSLAQRADREAAIQLALRAAADVPLEVMRLCALGLKHAVAVSEHACRAASNDVELAVALLRVGFSGARSNLETKLSSLTDVVYTAAVVEEIIRLTDETTTAARVAESHLCVPPA